VRACGAINCFVDHIDEIMNMSRCQRVQIGDETGKRSRLVHVPDELIPDLSHTTVHRLVSRIVDENLKWGGIADRFGDHDLK
jgi:hypothetical protein